MGTLVTEGVLEGAIAIEAALQGESREIQTLLIRRDKVDERIERLAGRAQTAGVKVERVPAEAIATHVSGQTHGGVIALVGSRRFQSLPELLMGKECPCLFMLDGVEDPFNFGDALRSLYAAGIDGLIVPPRNWTSAAGIVGRASAGASELMPMAVAGSALEAAGFLRAQGLAVACAVKRNALSIYGANLTGPLFVVLGGEKRGISRPLVEQADLLLQIPYGRSFAASLSVASAAAIMGFEIRRQRMLSQFPAPSRAGSHARGSG